MIYQKNNPVGVDVEIQRLQNYLHNELSDINISAYGRVYFIGKKPMLYYKNGDYTPILFLENEDLKFFFVEKASTTTASNVKTNIDLIVLANTTKIYPEIKHNADEEVHVKVYTVLREIIHKGDIEIEKGKEALSGFDSDLEDRLNPYSFYKYSFEIEYSIINC